MRNALWKTGLVLFFLLICVIEMQAVPPVTICQTGINSTSGLVALWHMNYDEDPIRDSFGNNTGAIDAGVENPTFSIGKFGGAYDFIGNNTYIIVASPISLAEFTVSVWWNPDGESAAGKAIISDQFATKVNYAIFYIESGASRKIIGGIYLAGWYLTTTEVTLTDNVWTYLALTYDGATLILYKDGVNVSSLVTAITPSSSGTGLRIGSRWDGGNSVDGTIDEVAVFSRALPVTEIKHTYHENPRSQSN